MFVTLLYVVFGVGGDSVKYRWAGVDLYICTCKVQVQVENDTAGCVNGRSTNKQKGDLNKDRIM